MPSAADLLDVIERRMEERGLSPATASRAAVGNPYLIYNFRKKGFDPKFETLRRLCDALGLEFYIGPPRTGMVVGRNAAPDAAEARPYDSDSDDAEHVLVPKLPVRLAAGHGAATLQEEEPVALLAFRREWMQRHGLQPGLVSAVEIVGDSMEPLLIDGDTVLVDHRRNEARQGKVFAVGIESDLLVKRLERQSEGGWILTSDNKSYEPISMSVGATLIGQVVWRGTWLGEGLAGAKEIADLERLFEIFANHRVETGAAASIDQAMADIKSEMALDGVFNDDE